VDITPDDLPRKVDKPWGYEIWYAWTDRYVGKIIHVNKGEKLSLQYHNDKDETSYLLKGRLLLTKGPSVDQLTVTEIGEGHQWRNRPGEIHTIEGVEDATFWRSPRPTSKTSSASRTATAAKARTSPDARFCGRPPPTV
jgi:mannose-6-phosphate isomerase-like protein (cupin superfamily)